MMYHHRCTNRNNCGHRVQTNYKFVSSTEKCPVCNKGWLNFDPSVRKQRANTKFCNCDVVHYPHVPGTFTFCKHSTKTPTDEDYINFYGRSYA